MSFDGGNVSTTSHTTSILNNNALADFYHRNYPTAEELLMDAETNYIEEEELQEMVLELHTEVHALQEETEILRLSAEDIKRKTNTEITNNNNNNISSNKLLNDVPQSGSALGSPSKFNNNNNNNNASSTALTPLRGAAGRASSSENSPSPTVYGGGGVKRGQQYRRKSLGAESNHYYVPLDDKYHLLSMQEARLKAYEEQTRRGQEEYKAQLAAAVEEAKKRMSELKLEVQQFQREVLGEALDNDDANNDNNNSAVTPTTVYAEEIQSFLEKRLRRQQQYYDKLKDQTGIAERNIQQAQAIAKQRQEAGDAFQLVDLEQLSIENEQLTERIQKKNNELAQLKTVSTRTVQTLNSLTNALNDTLQEQNKLKKEVKSRKDYLARCKEEIVTVTREASRTEHKNTVIKAQHEAVRVPKIEDYIAQKAELFELEKAVTNWERKVEIAKGQVKVLKGKIKLLEKQREATQQYAENKRRQSRKNIANTMMTNPNYNNNNNNSVLAGTSRSAYTTHQNPSAFTGSNNNNNNNNNLVMDSSPVPRNNNNNNNNTKSLDQRDAAIVGGSRSLLDAKRKP